MSIGVQKAFTLFNKHLHRRFGTQTSPKFSLSAIGRVVKSPYPSKFGVPRQSQLVPDAVGFIDIFPEYHPSAALAGLHEFSHSSTKNYHPTVHPPRLQGQAMGVFATRSPHRPNPLGLSLLQVLEVEAGGLWVGGLDVVEGTPVLDLKPYLPALEGPSPDPAKTKANNGWTDRLPRRPTVQVDWAPAALGQLAALRQGRPLASLLSLIEGTLALDPRPTSYKQGEQLSHSERPVGHASTSLPQLDGHILHRARFYDLYVHFRFLAPDRLSIDHITDKD